MFLWKLSWNVRAETATTQQSPVGHSLSKIKIFKKKEKRKEKKKKEPKEIKGRSCHLSMWKRMGPREFGSNYHGRGVTCWDSVSQSPSTRHQQSTLLLSIVLSLFCSFYIFPEMLLPFQLPIFSFRRVSFTSFLLYSQKMNEYLHNLSTTWISKNRFWQELVCTFPK